MTNFFRKYWAEARKIAIYVINRIPQQNLDYASPFKKLLDIKPNVSHLHIFSCVCYVFIPNHLQSKMEKKVVRCIFVGYDKTLKGWRCCDPNSGRCYVSRNFVFDENSSWWLEKHEVLPDSKLLKEEIESSKVRLDSEGSNVVIDNDDVQVQEYSLVQSNETS